MFTEKYKVVREDTKDTEEGILYEDRKDAEEAAKFLSLQISGSKWIVESVIVNDEDF